MRKSNSYHIIGAIFLVAITIRANGIERLSNTTTGTAANGNSVSPAVSANGQFVAFRSGATDLVPNDNNFRDDIFVADRQNGTISPVSVDSLGVQSNGTSYNPVISADGRYVAFESVATNLVANDLNNKNDIFVHDRQQRSTVRVSVHTNGAESNDDSFNVGISANGQFLVFESLASNLIASDENGVMDIFLHDLIAGETTRVSIDSGEFESDGESRVPTVSDDGRFVVFESDAINLVAADNNDDSDIFVRDRQNGTTLRVSVDSNGVEANNVSTGPAISGNGKFVAFASRANNLIVGDTNNRFDIFVHDLETAKTSRVSTSSTGAEADGFTTVAPSISTDGRYIAYWSDSTTLVNGDANSKNDIFVHDRARGATRRVSVSRTGGEASDDSEDPAISGDGKRIVFSSRAGDLVTPDLAGNTDVFFADNPIPIAAITAARRAAIFRRIARLRRQLNRIRSSRVSGRVRAALIRSTYRSLRREYARLRNL